MTDPQPPSVPAAWHPDPYDATRLRYWDGQRWTEHTAPGSTGTATVEPPRSQPPRSVAGLGKATLWLAVASTLAQVGLAAAAFNGEDNLIRDAETGSVTFGPYDGFGMLSFLIGLPTYIVTCLWLSRCRSNVDTLRPNATHARSRVWIWLGWMVPVVAVWFPFQVVRDIGSRPAEGGYAVRRPPALGVWWATWLVSSAAAAASFQISLSDEPVLMTALAEVDVANAAVMAVGMILWARIVTFIQRDQAELLAGAGIVA